MAHGQQTRLSQEQGRILRTYDEVRQELLSIPGVLGVGIGVKETDNEFTDEMSYRVYVAEKKPVEELTAAELIPPQIGDFRTDVLIPLRLQEDSDVCGDERPDPDQAPTAAGRHRSVHRCHELRHPRLVRQTRCR